MGPSGSWTEEFSLQVKLDRSKMFLPGAEVRELSETESGDRNCLELKSRVQTVLLRVSTLEDLEELSSKLRDRVGESILLEGLVSKYARGRHHAFRNWRERYCVLCRRCLYYFKPQTLEFKGRVDLSNRATLRGLTPDELDEVIRQKKSVFSLPSWTHETQFGVLVQTPVESFLMRLPQEHVRDEWLLRLHDSLQEFSSSSAAAFSV